MQALLSRVPDVQESAAPRTADRVYSLVITAGSMQVAQPPPQFLLYVNHDLLASTESLEEILDRFESDLDLYVAVKSKERLIVHAGAVGWKNQIVLIPGRSGSGKTSLVSEFLKCGATYYSDDWAVIDRDGVVHPYRRKLSIRTQNDARKRVDPEHLGAKCGEPLPISTVLITGYKQGVQWSPRATSPGHGFLALLENTPSAHTCPVFAMTVLPRVMAQATVYESARGDKEHTVGQILRCLERCACWEATQ
jgi:hypothetical protein